MEMESEIIKILFLAANPLPDSPLKLDEEIRLITEKVRASEHRNKLEIISAWAVRPDDLLQLLNTHKPHIVHFSGHGNPEGSIFLTDHLGQAKPVSSKAMKSLFAAVKDNIKVVFFNACYSKVQGEAVNEVIDYVIGMNAAIGDRAAIVFAASFYRALGFRRSIQEAFEQAITALLLENIVEEDTPKLLVKTASPCQGFILSTPNADEVEIPLRKTKENSTTRLQLQRKNNIDWGDAPDVPIFLGREEELKKLRKWIIEDHCRVVAILGIAGIGKTGLSIKLGKGGVGKTDLSLKLAHGIECEFEYVIWRRLLNAPPLSEILQDIIKFISCQEEIDLPHNIYDQVSRLIFYFNKHRCLLILDNVEAVLQGGEKTGEYRNNHEDYGTLFSQLGEVSHQSCLILTSREKPRELARLEGRTKPVRILELGGLSTVEGRSLFEEIDNFKGSDEEWKELIEFYNGNPLALELAAKHISEVFCKDISAFIKEGKPVFSDLKDLLNWHFDRLTDSEKEVMYWLAINRQPESYLDLREDILSPLSKKNLSSTIQSLQRRLPLEKSEIRFTLQPVIIEYMTDRLVSQIDEELTINKPEISSYVIENFNLLINEEIKSKNIQLLNSHALMKALAKDYIRESQIRLIIEPIIERMFSTVGDKRQIEIHLLKLLLIIKRKTSLKVGYAGGNILNLLCQLKTTLENLDFSQISVWQAYLRGVELYNVDFSHANLAKTVFTGTFGLILSVSFSPDNRFFATGSGNSEIQLWQVSDGKQILNLRGHSSWVVSLAFSPDSKMLASGSNDQTIRLWDVDSGECIKVLRGCTGSVRTVTFNIVGNILASGSEDCAIRLWDVNAGESLRSINVNSSVRTIAFSPHSNILASGGSTKDIHFWNVDTGQCTQVFEGHTDWVRSIAFSLDGSVLVSGSSDKTVRVWDVNNSKCLKTFCGHTDSVMVIALSPDKKLIVSSSNDKTIRLWDADLGRCIKVLQGHNSWVRALNLSKDGYLIASGSDDFTIKLWDSVTGHCLTTLFAYTSPMWSIDIDPTGKLLASGGNGKIWLWDIKAGYSIKQLHGHTNRIWSVAFNSDGSCLASASDDFTVRLWDVQSGQCVHTLKKHIKRLWSVAFCTDGRYLASAGEDCVCIWDVKTGSYVKSLQTNISCLRTVKFHPKKNNIIATGGEDAVIRVWNFSEEKCIGTLKGHNNWIWSIAYSPDGDLLASGSDDKTVRLWDTRTGECLKVFLGHLCQIRSVVFSPDGRFVASGSADNTVKLWDLERGNCVRTFYGHTGWIWSIVFDPTIQILVSCSEDETIRYWDIETAQCLNTLRNKRPYECMNITKVEGLTEAQKDTLRALGAVDNSILM